jgi:phage portal protein BeeE
MALRADDDLFPAGSDLQPEWLVDGLLRADTQVRYAAYVQARQAGWLSANEIRALENYPPVEGGDQVQQTPVGGAPNATPPATDTQGGAA